jgi:hypothetical protein
MWCTVAFAVSPTVKAKEPSGADLPDTDRKNQHGSQGTGNFKKNRDRHQKAGPWHEKKKRKLGWFFHRG